MSLLRRVHAHLDLETSYLLTFTLVTVLCAGPKWLKHSLVGSRCPCQCPKMCHSSLRHKATFFSPSWQSRTLHIFAMSKNIHKSQFMHMYTCASGCLLSAEGSPTPVSQMHHDILCPRYICCLHALGPFSLPQFAVSGMFYPGKVTRRWCCSENFTFINGFCKHCHCHLLRNENRCRHKAAPYIFFWWSWILPGVPK